LQVAFGHRGHAFDVAALEEAQEFLVEFLIDDEVRQAARRDDGNAHVLAKAFDRRLQRLAEAVHALRGRLVRRIEGVDQHRQVRDRLVLHDLAQHEAEGVRQAAARPFIAIARQRF